MNKTVKTILVVLLFGGIGVLIYWLVTRKKTTNTVDANGNTVVTLPPPVTAEPPATANTLTSADSGPGLAAINRRIGEILASNVWPGIEAQIRSSTDILKGVSEVKKGYYNNNISRAPITSAKNVPFNLGIEAENALAAFDSIDSSGGFATMSNLRDANAQLMAAVGTCYVGDGELGNQGSFDREVACQGYENCGKNYKSINAHIGSGAKKAAEDMKRISHQWREGVHSFSVAVRERAIQDLRAQGWKFIGYDQ